jgi:hypothetical protein
MVQRGGTSQLGALDQGFCNLDYNLLFTPKCLFLRGKNIMTGSSETSQEATVTLK